MNKLSKGMLDLVVQTLASAGMSELENAKQVVEHSGFSDEDTAPFLGLIEAKIEELETADTELDAILKRQDIMDHIQAEVKKATDESKAEIAAATTAKDEAEAALRNNTIDTIVAYNSVLRTDAIDPQNVTDSVQKLRDELSSKSNDELKDSLTDLAQQVNTTFLNSPSATLDNETALADGATSPAGSPTENNSDTSDSDQEIHTLSDLLQHLLKAQTKDTE